MLMVQKNLISCKIWVDTTKQRTAKIIRVVKQKMTSTVKVILKRHPKLQKGEIFSGIIKVV